MMIRDFIAKIIYSTSSESTKYKIIQELKWKFANPIPKSGGMPDDIIGDMELKLEKHCWSFSTAVTELRIRKNKSVKECVIKSGISYSRFNNVINGYYPSMDVAIRIIFSLEPTINEFSDLLKKAGYEFCSEKRATVIYTCIKKRCFNIHDINAILKKFDLPKICNNRYNKNDDKNRLITKKELINNRNEMSQLLKEYYISDPHLIATVLYDTEFIHITYNIIDIIKCISTLDSKKIEGVIEMQKEYFINTIKLLDEHNEIEQKSISLFYDLFIKRQEKQYVIHYFELIKDEFSWFVK